MATSKKAETIRNVKAAGKKVETKRYLVEKGRGRFIIEVPASWKVTYGPLAPGTQTKRSYEDKGMCLRFYEAQTKQRAVFTDVVEFRDLSLPMQVERVSKTGTRDWFADNDGNSSERNTVTVDKEFVDA